MKHAKSHHQSQILKSQLLPVYFSFFNKQKHGAKREKSNTSHMLAKINSGSPLHFFAAGDHLINKNNPTEKHKKERGRVTVKSAMKLLRSFSLEIYSQTTNLYSELKTMVETMTPPKLLQWTWDLIAFEMDKCCLQIYFGASRWCNNTKSICHQLPISLAIRYILFVMIWKLTKLKQQKLEICCHSHT